MSKFSSRVLFSALLPIWLVFCSIYWVRPVVADDLDIGDEGSSNSFFDETPVLRDTKWQFTVGVGGSFISPYTVELPLYTGAPPVQRNLGTAVSFEGSLCRDLSSWFSIGLMGGVSTTHSAAASAQEAFGVPVAYANIRYDLTVSKILPMIQAGPAIDYGKYVVRPYVMAALGGYQINQETYFEYYTEDFHIDGHSNNYLGAAGGLGVSVTFPGDYLLGLQGKYEQVFSPGQKLYFLIPSVMLGYRF